MKVCIPLLPQAALEAFHKPRLWGEFATHLDLPLVQEAENLEYMLSGERLKLGEG